MANGCTAILTLLKPEHRDLKGKADDEQLHVLPHYAIDTTDESGSVEGQKAKIHTGLLQTIQKYDRKQILRPKKLLPKKRSQKNEFKKKFLENFAKNAAG